MNKMNRMMIGNTFMRIFYNQRFEQFLRMLKFISEKPEEIRGNLLIVSGASIGNVPALTCDQIIKGNQFKRIGYFQTKYLEPSIGYLPQGIQNGSLGLPAELYHKGSVLILQFRSFCRFARKRDLAKEVVEQFKRYGVQEIVLISSFPYEIRPDLQIGSVENNIYFKAKGKVSDIKIVQNKQANLLSISHLIDDEDLECDLLKNGGLANAFYQQTSNIVLLFIFSEGQQDLKLVAYFKRYLAKLIDRKEIA